MQSPESLRKLLIPVIREAIAAQPRTLQKRIGCSEIGNPCQHCLTAKLAGWEKFEPTEAWLPFIGTAVHAQLETIFNGKGMDSFLTETRVSAGRVGDTGLEVTGTSDLFHIPTGTVIDWKIVGRSTLDEARRGNVKPTYRVQAHTYGKGFINAGYNVNHVAIAFLPRNEPTLTKAVFWTEQYNPQVVEAAYARLEHALNNLNVMSQLGTKARDEWISTLPRAEGCFDCPKYADWQPPARTLTSLLDT